jgi:hypothetical protein
VLDGYAGRWGPKAAIGATSQVLKVIQVYHAAYLASVMLITLGQTSLENKQDIEDIVEAVQKIVEALTSIPPNFSAAVSPELQDRTEKHLQYVKPDSMEVAAGD